MAPLHLLILLAGLSATAALPCHAALLRPAAVDPSSQFNSTDSAAARLIDPGQPSQQNPYWHLPAESSTALHPRDDGGSDFGQWTSASGPITGTTLTFRLTAPSATSLYPHFNLTRLYLWQGNQNNLTNRGVKDFTLATSTNGGLTWTPAPGSFLALQASPSDSTTAAQTFPLTANYVTDIRLTILTNWGNPDFVSLSEIRFEATPWSPPQSGSQLNLYLSPFGSDSQPGTLAAPVKSLLTARDRMRTDRAANGLPARGVNLWLRGGRYPQITKTTLAATDSGTPDAPITIASLPGERAIIDASLPISPSAFSLVTDAPSLAKLPASSAGQVLAQTLSDPALISRLTDPAAKLTINDRIADVARFPNSGLGKIASRQADDTGAANEKGTPTAPVGARCKMEGSYDGTLWMNELNRLKKARMIGYVSANWQNVTLRLHSCKTDGEIRLMDATSYGFTRTGIIGRPYVDNLLAELDTPGEWFFDDTDNKLYLWPSSPLLPSTAIGVFAGTEFLENNGANYVYLKNITFQNFGSTTGDGVIDIRSGTGNLVAGCTFRNLVTPYTAVNLLGTYNGMLSCDLYDIISASRLGGGSASNNSITPGGNFIENCHFTQLWSQGLYGKVSGISGAGNFFRHNLMHNHNGQTVTISGQDHLVEQNEIFNTGIEEGDGGSFYQGASASSWGNLYRNNFWHHIICIPQLIERAAIFSDDGDMGDSVTDNVFYKAGESFKMNQGAGHTGSDNVFLAGIHSLLVLNGDPTAVYNTNMNYLDTDPVSTAKDSLLGRGLATFGIDNWASTVKSTNWNTHITPFWRNRYPLLNTVLDNWWRDKKMYKWNSFNNNIYFAHTNSSPTGVSVPAQTTVSAGTTLTSLSPFTDPVTLNFQWKTPLPTYAPDIPFNDIGLYADEYRTVLPDKATYRGITAEHWKNTTSEASGTYSPDSTGRRIYFNTGLLALGLTTPGTTPPPTPLTVLSDSIRDWAGATAPQPHSQWQHGYFTSGTTFTRCLTPETGFSWLGGNADILSTAPATKPSVGRFSLLPSATSQAVRRWTSLTDSRLRATVDARQIDTSANGQAIRIYKNGIPLRSATLDSTNRHQTLTADIDVLPGDTLDFSLDSLGNTSGDWTCHAVRLDNLTPADPALAAWWPLDETTRYPSGNNSSTHDRRLFAADFSGNQHPLTLTNMNGSFAWLPGQLGSAIHFAGIDDYAVTTTQGIGNGATELTLSLWFRPQIKGPNNAMLASETATGLDYFALLLNGADSTYPLEFRAKSNGLVAPPQTAPPGEWAHAAGVWKAGAFQRLYLNGTEIAAKTSSINNTPVNVGQWFVGTDRLIAGRYYDGAVDDIALYTRALSAPEVQSLYQNSRAGYAAPLTSPDPASDGLPDDWQQKYFGTTSGPAAPTADPDRDGQTNLAEWLAGTAPDNPSSRFTLTLATTATDSFTLQWPSIPGRTYQIESSSALTEAWFPEASPRNPTPPTNTATLTNIGTRRFYRIKVLFP